MGNFLAASTRSKRSSNSAARFWPSLRLRWCRSAIKSRFSSPVNRLSTAENWPVTPIAARTAAGSRVGLWPATSTSPLSAWMSVERICTIVVLPAPLGPSSAKTVPLATFRSMSSRTRCLPKALHNPLVSIIIMTFDTFLCYNTYYLDIQRTVVIFARYASRITMNYLVFQGNYIINGEIKIVKGFSEKTDGGSQRTHGGNYA